ncbi:hypothetical protein F1654_09570 [Alkalicaulis satelles]|uniref:OAR domain-containing protein n=1 Tax=Alkalicaulis satelles TaxID=2609175 RepID=A0A5M6ZH19_9PROT|nr:hypothetical protein [Alkalicaulis satelles]KAA5804019.1 hypothetical protein F1654_09570 [Alkalicaulis satelles]
MPRQQSPGYPNMSLQKAIDRVRKIHDADRTAEIDRETAAIHLGYSGLSGASDKAIASLVHYGLLERGGKGLVRVSKMAVDILHPDSPAGKRRALVEAAFHPQVFRSIKERFPHVPSEPALKSWLVRENFQDRAIGPVTQAYLDTCRYLEQEEVDGSGGPSAGEAGESSSMQPLEGSATTPKVGDYVQWDSGGALQFEKPRRIRWVSDDEAWLAVEGSDTGIPMTEVSIEKPPAPPSGVRVPPEGGMTPPPAPPSPNTLKTQGGERPPFKVIQEGAKIHVEAYDLNASSLARLRRKLEKYQEILEMDTDEDEEEGDL